VVLLDLEQDDAYTPVTRRALEQTWERADRAYRDLPGHDLRVIHCDLWHENLKLHRGVLHPFDFEDTVRGYRLHDLAMGLLDLAEDFGVERYEVLFPAVRAGYERHLPWPEGDLVALQMGRVIWRLNWIARHQRRWLPEEAEFCADLFARVRRSGRLVDPLRLG
jgi:Ser/Thr protein kinase RdoA (MazF antagonist)